MHIYRSVVLLACVLLQRNTMAVVECEDTVVKLSANSTEQVLVSTEYEHFEEETTSCKWTILASSYNDVIQIQLLHWFAPPTSGCSKDYLIATEGSSAWSRPLRIWCSTSHLKNEVVTSRSNTVTLEIVSSRFWEERFVFVLSYRTESRDITITTPVSLGVANYILIVFSVLAGAAFTFGVGLLVYREYKRNKDVKVSRFKERLNVRRKGISGMSSVYTMERFDTVSSLESTSYLQLSVSPTSGFGSQDGTPISSKFKDKFR